MVHHDAEKSQDAQLELKARQDKMNEVGVVPCNHVAFSTCFAAGETTISQNG